MLPGQYDFHLENAIKSAEKRKKIRWADYQNRKRKKAAATQNRPTRCFLLLLLIFDVLRIV